MSPDKQEQRQSFTKEAMLLHNSLTLCRSLLNTQQRNEAAFFEAVRTLLTRMTGKGKISKRDINARISELLKHSIRSERVINLFSDVKAEFSLFDAAFLDDISKMKEKNIAVEMLKKYNYPPGEAANALETVIRQCEQWTDNEAVANEPKTYSLNESYYSMAAENPTIYNGRQQ